MTILIGMLCSDGIVIGSDSAYTASNAIEKSGNKIDIIDNKIIVGIAGNVLLGQRFANIVKSNSNFIQNATTKNGDICNNVAVSEEVACFLHREFAKTNSISQYANSKFFIAALTNNQLSFYTFTDGTSGVISTDVKIGGPERDGWYECTGSGHYIANSCIALTKQLFGIDNIPTVETATLLCYWAIKHSIEINPGGINEPINIAALYKNNNNAVLLSDIELDDLEKRINEIITKAKSINNIKATSRTEELNSI
jgi:20S proteasome alpha/beta subunit